MDTLGSVNSGSPHRSNVTFKAEKIFLVYVKVLGDRRKPAVGELWQEGEGTGTIKQAISLSEYCPQDKSTLFNISVRKVFLTECYRVTIAGDLFAPRSPSTEW